MPTPLRTILSDLIDVVLPVPCPGCGGEPDHERGPLCRGCARVFAATVPRTARPDPVPAGLPPCVAGGWYVGPLRALLLAYKARGWHALAGVLGDRLAAVIAAAGPRDGPSARRPLVLVPVPATARAVRDRHGDHILRLAGHAAGTLRAGGRRVAVRRMLVARARPDSVGLDAAARARAARDAFAPRAPAGVGPLGSGPLGAGPWVVLVDDILTTGSTLAAASQVLARAGVRVDAAAVVAATRRTR